MALPSSACYAVLIDWYADGDYTDSIDDVSGRVLASPGISIQYGRDTARSTGPPMIGVADFTLDNRDRMLSPANGASPAYQFLLPGRPVKIHALHGTRSLYREHTLYRENDPYRGVADYTLATGQLEAMQHHPSWGQQVVSVAALSTIKRLQRQVISIPLYGPGATRTDTAVGYVLAAAGWPSDKQVLSVSDSILHYFWVDERPAWDVLVELVATEGPGSLLYQDGDGVLYWKNRNHRTTEGRSTTIQATLTDGTADGDLIYTDMQYDPRWDDIITRATLATKAREPATTPEVIWELGHAHQPLGPPGDVFWARPSDPFVSAIALAAGTDYTVTGGTATVALSWTNGAVAKITVTATSGAPTVDGLQLRAYPVRVIGETTIEALTDEPDPTVTKTLAVAAWPELDPAHAQSICQSYLERYYQSRPLMTVTVPATSGDALKRLLRLAMSDRLRIINYQLVLDVDVFIEQIAHRIGAGGRHELILSCEPAWAVASSGAVWDHPSAVWDGPSTLWGL